MNSCNGIVATFNLQGAAWSRSQRKYALHDKLPGPLSAAVSPIDLQPYQVGALQAPTPPLILKMNV